MLISSAHAQTPAATTSPGGDGFFLLLMIGMFVLMYFTVIRPQSKRAKEHRAMLDALAKGDEVVTAGGIAGKVTDIGDAFVKVEIASGVEVQVQKPTIGAVLPKGTLKNA